MKSVWKRTEINEHFYQHTDEHRHFQTFNNNNSANELYVS